MDQQFQPSFIPKKPNAGKIGFNNSPKSSGGVLYLLGSILFVFALISAIGVFAYEKYLESSISKKQSSLESAREALNPELVKELSRSNSRITSAQEILSRHSALTNFFSLLNSLTLQSLRFTDFSLISQETNERITVKMTGEARDYKTIALQSKIFSENPSITNSNFFDFSVNEGGNVTFVLEAQLAPQLILFERNFEATPATVPIQEPLQNETDNSDGVEQQGGGAGDQNNTNNQ